MRRNAGYKSEPRVHISRDGKTAACGAKSKVYLGLTDKRLRVTCSRCSGILNCPSRSSTTGKRCRREIGHKGNHEAWDPSRNAVGYWDDEVPR